MQHPLTCPVPLLPSATGNASAIRALLLALFLLAPALTRADEPCLKSELVFPLNPQHNHAPGVAELPNGDLFCSWYRGSGERSADDVAVYGARLKKGAEKWSDAEVLHDTPGFPDCNTCLMVDKKGQLWLFWPVIIANSWESCLTHYKVASKLDGDGAPKWDRHETIYLKPADFREKAEAELEKLVAKFGPALPERSKAVIAAGKERLAQKLYQRLGWQPRCKPTTLASGRILLPLYTDTFSISLMAISDDGGDSWRASEPLMGFGAIQPAVLQKKDGTLVAYMRENGYTGKIRTCESKDGGMTWGEVGISELVNPGSGLDAVKLASGAWLLIHNDTSKGRHQLAVSLSDDEGATWKWTRHLEKAPEGEGGFHYPTIIQTKDGAIHAVYSYFVKEGKSMKHAKFNEAWIKAGDDVK
jgi:predicted neuraminidase